MIDGPNATGYDNSMEPLVLYALCTNLDSSDSPAQAVDEVFIGSDPAALAKYGEQLQAQFALNQIKGVTLHYRVAQCSSTPTPG
jgi:hypothetical protein